MPESEIASLNLFEFWSAGHPPTFLRLIFEMWPRLGTGVLRAFVTRRFVARFPNVFHGLDNAPGSRIRWVVLDADDDAFVQAAVDYTSGTAAKPAGYDPSTVYWPIIEKYAARHPAKHALLMDLDDLVHPIAAGRTLPTDFSGALFLPGFAYDDAIAVSGRRKAFSTMQAALMKDRVLRHPQLRTLFLLDEAVVKGLAGRGTADVVFLADPGQSAIGRVTAAERAAIRARLGIADDGRRLYLFFGDMRPRKGFVHLFRALELLTPEERRRMHLAIVGFAEQRIEERIAQSLAAMKARNDIDVTRVASFVPSTDMHAWFDAADVAVAPYIRHSGSSGVLMLAASHGIPAISQSFGQMGRLVEEHRLGVAVDPEDSLALAHALLVFLPDSGMPEWTPEGGYQLARSWSPERFGETLFGSLRRYYA